MKLAVSLKLRGESNLIACRKYLGDMPVELVLDASLLNTLSVGDIVDAPLDIGIRVFAIKVPLFNTTADEIVNLAEKAAICATEMNSAYVVIPISEQHLDALLKNMDGMFDVFASYGLKACLEPKVAVLGKVFNAILSCIGGVFTISLSNEPDQTAVDILECIDNHFRLVRMVKLVNFDENGLPISLFNEKGLVNVYYLIKKLVEMRYTDYLVVDYDGRGLGIGISRAVSDLKRVREYLEMIYCSD